MNTIISILPKGNQRIISLADIGYLWHLLQFYLYEFILSSIVTKQKILLTFCLCFGQMYTHGTCLGSFVCLTSIRRTNFSSYLHASRLLPADQLNLQSIFVCSIIYSIIRSVACAADPQPMIRVKIRICQSLQSTPITNQPAY